MRKGKREEERREGLLLKKKDDNEDKMHQNGALPHKLIPRFAHVDIYLARPRAKKTTGLALLHLIYIHTHSSARSNVTVKLSHTALSVSCLAYPLARSLTPPLVSPAQPQMPFRASPSPPLCGWTSIPLPRSRLGCALRT